MAAAFRFVIIGSGSIAGTYVRALRAVPQAALVGVVSRSASRPASLTADQEVEVAPTLAGMRAPYDAVILATPNGMHHQGAMEAAALGKHVLTEKPLAVTLPDADAAIGACRAAGVTLGVCFQRRFSPDNVAVKKILDSGTLGRVFAADVAVKYYREQSYYDGGAYRGTWAGDGGGALMQQACHQVDLYTWFFGTPRRVRAAAGTLGHRMESEDHVAAVMEHGTGMIGTFVASTVTRPGFPARIEIHGEAGSILMENDMISRWLVEGAANPSRPPGAPIHSGAGADGAAVNDTAGHEAVIADFVRAVRDRRPPAVTGEDARVTTELILSIYGAARS